MLKMGIITESDSPWSAPVLLVKKANGEQRFCVDYRKLNSITTNVFQNLITMDEILDCMSENQPKIFSSLDMRQGYYQVPMDPASRAKTAFSTPDGQHFEFTRMPFGLKNAPFSFIQMTSSIFKRILFKYCLAYLDDVLVFSSTLTDHIAHLDEVFKRLRAANLRLHPKKCKFALPEIRYLGHTLSKDGVSVDQSKVTAVKDYPRPTNLKTVRGFLGLSGYFRRFIKNYAKIANPIHQLLKKSIKFEWTDDCEKAFQTLKTALITAPVLQFPDLNKEFTLVTDASKTAIGYFLTQNDDNGLAHPIAYAGRAIRKNEANWSVGELELLAILQGCRHFHVYLANRPFKVLCDHISLKYIDSLRLETGRLGRWALYLMNYNFTISHYAGNKNQCADALSRREYPPEPPKDIEEEFQDNLMTLGDLAIEETPVRIRENKTLLVEFEYKTQAAIPSVNVIDEPTTVVEVDLQDIIPLQRNCPDTKPFFDYFESGILPEGKNEARKLVIESEFYEIIDGRLYHIHHPRDKGISQLKVIMKQLCVPRDLRLDIVPRIS